MLDPGLTLGGRYTLQVLIARGGMGEVWRAEDTVLGRRVAVKVLLPNLAVDPGFAARFRAEAQAMAALSDPGIVEIYDYGQADGIAYLVMQFVEGESLLSLVRRVGPLEPARAMRLLARAADAIHAAHLQGIVHRDVKPANLLLRQDGRLALTDFGIARIVAADRLTAAGEIFGTASYLAPEQVTGGDIGPATDVYALGVVAYEMLTQRRPFAGDTPLAVALQHVNEPPPDLPGSVPEPVRAVVMRALAKDPAERWPSAAALSAAASAAAGPGTPATASAAPSGAGGASAGSRHPVGGRPGGWARSPGGGPCWWAPWRCCRWWGSPRSCCPGPGNRSRRRRAPRRPRR
ncbi:protein kinase [Catellatospora coxensis]